MRALVTGGTGFLGQALVRALLARGDAVSFCARHNAPQLVAAGARFVPCDLAAPQAAEVLRVAGTGTDVIFHTAAKTGVWGSRADFMAINLGGTRALLAALAELGSGAPALVHTSSPSVCFDGRDHRRAGPDLPRGRHFPCAYPESKALAEEAVESAARETQLAVCILRPHLIYGPGDPHLLPRIIARARAGRLRRVGDGQNEVSLCYIEHAVAAQLAAGDQLLAAGPAAPCAGRAYFIADDKPVLLWPWIDELLQAAGLDPIRAQLPRRRAALLGAVLETLWRILPLSGEPPMTRFVAAELSTSHSYDMGPARRDLGYRPSVGAQQARLLALADLRERGLLP
ncbi:MAG TPA: NAD-dependent epimerase/dehydratase family protein [Planctomycetota bacterium]|nr:NAD-dependent epimerase/dehydratase family protein [Planctomycetota bacterium]